MTASAFRYRPRSKHSIILRLLDYEIDGDILRSILDPVGVGVQRAADRIGAGSDDDIPPDDELALIEGLLGVAYVACEVKILAIVTAALRFPAVGDRENAERELRALGRKQSGTEYSQVEVLWQLANFYKHRDEWPVDAWDPTARRAGLASMDKGERSEWRRRERTITVLSSFAPAASAPSLRLAADVLGNPNYANVQVFGDIIADWAEAVRASVGTTSEQE